MWGSTVGAIMDEKGIAHFYLHNSSLLAETVHWRTILGTAEETDTFKFNMLELEEEVAAIFGMEMTTLHSGPPTEGHKKPPTNPIECEMIQAMVDCSVPKEWHIHFAKLLDNYLDIISESKTNLGCSDMVIHDIELTDHTPVYTKQFPLPPDH
jgi:hypothetical protein